MPHPDRFRPRRRTTLRFRGKDTDKSDATPNSFAFYRADLLAVLPIFGPPPARAASERTLRPSPPQGRGPPDSEGRKTCRNKSFRHRREVSAFDRILGVPDRPKRKKPESRTRQPSGIAHRNSINGGASEPLHAALPPVPGAARRRKSPYAYPARSPRLRRCPKYGSRSRP